MKNVEVEIQVNVEYISSLLKFLKTKAKFISNEREIDEYFTPVHRDFIEKTPVCEWFRIRNASGKYSINYKNWHYTKTGRSTHADEFETGIESSEQMHKILRALDFKPIVVVDKKRQKYHFKNYEITIDDVKGLEQAVEVEYRGRTDKAPKQITLEMIKFLKDLGVGKMKRSYQGYAFLVLSPERAEFEEIN